MLFNRNDLQCGYILLGGGESALILFQHLLQVVMERYGVRTAGFEAIGNGRFIIGLISLFVNSDPKATTIGSIRSGVGYGGNVIQWFWLLFAAANPEDNQ